MMIVIAFHQSGYQNFKTYYIHFVCRYLTNEFSELIIYTRMLKLIQGAMVPLYSYLTHRQARLTGIALVDSSTLQVCHNLRILRYQVCKCTEKRGKGTIGSFYGFKLHLIINDQGGIISIKVTMANVDDKKPVSEMVNELWACLYGDKYYISSPLERELADNGVTLITGVKRNKKPKMMELWNPLMLRKRFIIEIVFDRLKNISQIKHSRHHNCISSMVNLLAGIIAYSLKKRSRISR
ncbi:Mobile element protein [Candidatus Enterovibrio escicola]|uniref:Mobile element protein n=1 Tax=Candidatus Enterovibrio escicola TaxID=1927127 RepID=A0A2A5T548_9GAMM|nr:Mobile element protein [Candidatus Enterovibrio escacola]